MTKAPGLSHMERNQGYSYRLQLDGRAVGQTVLSLLSSEFTHSSAEQWTARIRRGEVLLNGQPTHAQQQLAPGASLVWNRPGWREETTPLSYECIYEDEHLLAVSKPSGLPTLPGGGFYQNTLLHLVRQDFPQARPLHRLGRGTSGIVLFARNRLAAATISRQWPAVTKQYRALSSGRAEQRTYDIRSSIGRITHPRLGTVHAVSEQGKAARSVARVLYRGEGTTLFEVDLHSGRPHQIRIHLASIGFPLVGDPMYAAGGGLQEEPGLPGDLGYLLHASRLVLRHPIDQRVLDLRSRPPQRLCAPQQGVSRPDPDAYS